MEWISKVFDFISEMVGLFTAIASVVILIVMFFLLDFKFILRAYAMIRSLFKEQNIPLVLAVVLPWKLKKIYSENKQERYKILKGFCEYAIFESKGEKLSKLEWGKLFQKFFYEHILDAPYVLNLDSTFDILNENVDSCIKDYFAFLNKNRKNYYHDIKNSKFVCTIIFVNGFVYPSSFINGLERKFSDSWTDLLVKYNYTLKNSKYRNSKDSASLLRSLAFNENQHFIESQNDNMFSIRSNELFMMYSWLMWSPSYQMQFTDDKYKIILYGIGDESNTTNLIIDNSKVSTQLWNRLKGKISNKIFGETMSIECELYEFLPYIKHNIHNFANESLAIVNNLMNNSNDTHYILNYLSTPNISEFQVGALYEDNDAFFSGYLWAVFARFDQKHTRFEIKNTVAFFEHTNLADTTSIDFFTKSMAQKTILHFKAVFADKIGISHYELVCSVSNFFRTEYIKLLTEAVAKQDEEFQQNFAKYVSLEGSNVTINEILENIDEEFPLNEFDYIPATTPDEIAKFYATIYVDNFAPDERDSIDDLIYRTLYLKSENHHDIILAYLNGELAGGIVFDWFKKSNCGAIEYLVVDKKYRGMRVAKRLIAKATATMTHYSTKDPLKAIFIEVEDPRKITGVSQQIARDNYRRLQLWSDNYYRRLDINFIQPALNDELNLLDNLFLAVNTLNSSIDSVDAKTLTNFLIDYNVICNRVKDVNDEKYGIKPMFDEINSKKDGIIKAISFFDEND